MTDAITKRIFLKFVGANREGETLSLDPGTTCRDVLQAVGLGAGYSLTDPANPDAVFQSGDNIYARVNDGDALAIVSTMDAGLEDAA